MKAKRYARPINFGGKKLPSCEIVLVLSGPLRGRRVVIAWGWTPDETYPYHGTVELAGVAGTHTIIGHVHDM